MLGSWFIQENTCTAAAAKAQYAAKATNATHASCRYNHGAMLVKAVAAGNVRWACDTKELGFWA
jgi:hypothetical protein